MKNSKMNRVFMTFDNPLYAWDLMNGTWGELGNNLYILNDEEFASVIIKRAIIRLIDYKLGNITREECWRDLGIAGKFSNYLIDFNFFHYSKHTGLFYASKEDTNFKPSLIVDEAKAFFDELAERHNFYALINMAMNVFYDLKDLTEKYSEEELIKIINGCSFYGFE